MAGKAVKKKAALILEPYVKPDFGRLEIKDVSVDPEGDLKCELGVELARGFAYYHDKRNTNDPKKWLVAYMRSVKANKDLISIVSKAKDSDVFPTIGILARMLTTDNCPAFPMLVSKVQAAVDAIQEKAAEQMPEADEAAPAPSNVVSIHDRMVEKVRDFLGEHVEGEIDSLFRNKGKSDFKLASALDSNQIPAKHAQLIADAYKSERDEIAYLLTPPKKVDKDYLDQLKEAYPQSKAELKRILAFFEMLIADAEHHVGKKKAVRKTRAKKAPTADKLVAKLKYKKDDQALKIVSEDPRKLVGAKEVWFYHTKYRKIGHIVAENADMGGVLSVRGTSIVGIDDSKNVMKTVRKPEEVLKDFKGAGKVKLRKFMDGINSVGTKFPGRTNEHIVFLKIIT